MEEPPSSSLFWLFSLGSLSSGEPELQAAMNKTMKLRATNSSDFLCTLHLPFLFEYSIHFIVALS
ncbi:hypothetical protein AQ616_01335 [Oceanobacillus sp. E9]|nr:hypothetical protein AQ616_01335 [Oceanobacillus sp. E9]